MHRTTLQEGTRRSNNRFVRGGGVYVTQIERLICGRLSEQASKQDRQQAGNIINHQHTNTHTT